MTRLALLAILALGADFARAGVVSQGADAFDAGQLDQAIAPWEVAAQTGRASGTVHYNLGTAWYLKGDLPRAIAHYRAAYRLRPRDGNVQHNLAVARSELADPPPPVPPRAGWMSLVTVGELGVVGVVLSAVASVLALAWRRRRNPTGVGPVPIALIGIIGLVAGCIAVVGARAQRDTPTAVVVQEAAVARDSASPVGAVRFALPAGSEVKVVRQFGGFALVEDGSARRGWLASSAALVVWPPQFLGEVVEPLAER